MTLIIESYELTRCKSGDVVVTFDHDRLLPIGDLVMAAVRRGVLELAWADGTVVLLLDAVSKIAAFVAAAPVVRVRWVANNLFRGSDLKKSYANPSASLST